MLLIMEQFLTLSLKINKLHFEIFSKMMIKLKNTLKLLKKLWKNLENVELLLLLTVLNCQKIYKLVFIQNSDQWIKNS